MAIHYKVPGVTPSNAQLHVDKTNVTLNIHVSLDVPKAQHLKKTSCLSEDIPKIEKAL